MASGALGGTLRHLRDLFHDGTAVGLGDGQLLARYAASRDEAAFEAMVARHGPMVLATCRAVLRHEHDVEDAFQATFLVLARKARSVRAGDALGGWLHRIAYRTAVQAQRDARRRRRREAKAAAMATIEAIRTDPGPEPDLASIVHEELDRLPDRHRLPVVLCDLEGLTYEQAAGRLRWSEPTLRHRLVQARRRLRERLTRRGVTAGAVGVATVGSGASAVVPAAWARAAVMAATGGTASASAAALTRIIIRSMLMTRLKAVSAGIVAAVALATAGVLAVGAARRDDPRPAMDAQAGAHMKRPAEAREVPTPTPAPGELIEVRGRVVDPEGRPVAGAAVRGTYFDRYIGPAPETISGPDGRFTLRVPSWRHDSARRPEEATFPWVTAAAPGFGPGWVSAVRPPDAPAEAGIRLVEDDPIEGRIVDLQGQPVAGARVKVQDIWLAGEGGLSAWIERARDKNVPGPPQGFKQLPVPVDDVTTGPDGRFRLSGIGRDRIAELLVSGPRITTAQLFVLSRDGPAIRTTQAMVMMPEKARITHTTYHPRRFEYAAEPTRPIEGVVRDKDTGRPIAGLMLHAAIYEETFIDQAAGVEATTDAQGRYRLTGLPRAAAYRVIVEQAKGKPYHRATLRVPGDSAALGPVTLDIALKRGILIRGRVTDKATGRPVPGYVNAFTFRDNPAVKEFPGYGRNGSAYVPLEEDGSYEVVGLPGRNLIACQATLEGRYRQGVGAAAIKGYDPNLLVVGGFETVPGICFVNLYHVLGEVDIDPGAGPATLDLQVDPGRTLKIEAVDPDGRPIAGTSASGVTDLFSHIEYAQATPTIEVHALHPSKPRRVTVTHAGRKLLGSVYLKGDEAGPLTLRLRPWGTIAGRIVDDEGKPRMGVELSSLGGGYPARPDVQGVLPGTNSSPSIPIGRDGRFRIEGLIPGLKYGAAARGPMYLGVPFRDVTVAPGEVKDLGDLKITTPDRGK